MMRLDRHAIPCCLCTLVLLVRCDYKRCDLRGLDELPLQLSPVIAMSIRQRRLYRMVLRVLQDLNEALVTLDTFRRLVVTLS